MAIQTLQNPGGASLETTGADQYGRAISLIVFGPDFDGLDLSPLRIKFSIKRSETQTPNTADIRVYNLSEETAMRVRDEFKKVILQAGYEGNLGVIFQGNIKQVILGRESATDTFIDIVAGDGDRAYNFAVVTKTLAAGTNSLDQAEALIQSMNPKGVTAGHIGEMPTEKLPRGKVLYGNSRNYLRNIAETADKTWSIQNEQVTFIPKRSYLPGESVVLTSKTGMIGTPQQTNVGINIKCLLNPIIKIGGTVKIDNKSVEQFKINLDQPNSAANIPPPFNADGVYFVMCIEHNGDTRGVDWYSTMICLSVSVTTNPANAIPVSFG